MHSSAGVDSGASGRAESRSFSFSSGSVKSARAHVGGGWLAPERGLAGEGAGPGCGVLASRRSDAALGGIRAAGGRRSAARRNVGLLRVGIVRVGGRPRQVLDGQPRQRYMRHGAGLLQTFGPHSYGGGDCGAHSCELVEPCPN